MKTKGQILLELKQLEAKMDAMEAGPHEIHDLLAAIERWWHLDFELEELEKRQRLADEGAAEPVALKVGHLRQGGRP